MRFLPLIWRNAWRRPLRTLFTLGAIFVAFLLFGLLMAVRQAFSFGVQVAGADRLVLVHKTSIIMPLPESYKPQLQRVDGVAIATHQTWFGGVYQDPSNFFPQFVVEPEEHLQMYPELHLPDDERAAWLADRQGAIVGRELAERYGWKVGDRVPLQATIWQPKEGGAWELNISGIYAGDEGLDESHLYFRYDYLDENRRDGDGFVGWYLVRIADASRAVELAAAFDDMFANSQYETKTTTEKGFIEGFANQMGNVGAIMIAIATAVLFNILLIAATTMAQAVRERTSELAVLKTLGFPDAAVLALVLTESVCIAGAGGGAGLLLAWALVQQGDPTGGALPIFILPVQDLAAGIALVMCVGVLAGVVPAVSAMRLTITEALRR